MAHVIIRWLFGKYMLKIDYPWKYVCIFILQPAGPLIVLNLGSTLDIQLKFSLKGMHIYVSLYSYYYVRAFVLFLLYSDYSLYTCSYYHRYLTKLTESRLSLKFYDYINLSILQSLHHLECKYHTKNGKIWNLTLNFHLCFNVYCYFIC